MEEEEGSARLGERYRFCFDLQAEQVEGLRA